MQAISSFKLLNVRPFLCRGGTCKGDMKMALKFLDGRRDEPSYVRANDVSIPPFFPRKKNALFAVVPASCVYLSNADLAVT